MKSAYVDKSWIFSPQRCILKRIFGENKLPGAALNLLCRILKGNLFVFIMQQYAHVVSEKALCQILIKRPFIFHFNRLKHLSVSSDQDESVLEGRWHWRPFASIKFKHLMTRNKMFHGNLSFRYGIEATMQVGVYVGVYCFSRVGLMFHVIVFSALSTMWVPFSPLIPAT